MGRLLTLLAGLLVLALIAVAAAPYVIDWDRYRSVIETRIAGALHLPFKVAGKIELNLLPAPVIRLSDVTVGTVGAEARIAQIVVELAVGALLKGEWQASDVRLENPKLWISLDHRGRFTAQAVAGEWSQISIERLVINEGEITIEQEERGTRFFIDDIAVSATAQSLLGPWKADGRARFEGSPLNVSVQTGRGDADGIRAKIAVTPHERPVAFELDALIGRDKGKPTLTGALKLSGVGALDAARRDSGWKIEAQVDAGSETFIAKDLRIVPASDERVIALNGLINLALGEQTRADAVLSVRQLDIDRLAGVSSDAPADLPTILERLSNLPAALALPIDMRLQASFDASALIIAGGSVQDAHIVIEARKGAWRLKEATAKMPGQTTMRLSADLGHSIQALAVAGMIELESRALSTFTAWMQGDLLRPQSERPAVATGNLVLNSHFSLSSKALTLDQLSVGVPGATLRGQLAYGWGGAQSSLVFQGEANEIDLAPVAVFLAPFHNRLLGALGGDAAFTLKAKRLRYPGLEMIDADVALKRDSEGLRLERVHIGGLNGLAVEGSGRLSLLRDSSAQLTVEGQSLRPAFSGLSALMPGSSAIAALLARADALSPLKLKLALASATGEVTATAEGEAGGSQISGEARLALGLIPTLLNGRVDIQNTSAAQLLRQLGLSSGTTLTPAPGRLSAKVNGEGDGSGNLSVDAELAGSRLAVAGRVALSDLTTLGPGLALAFSSSDATPLLLSLGSVTGHVEEEVPAAGKGRLAIDAGTMRLTEIEAEIGGTRLRGGLAITRQDVPVVSGQIDADLIAFDRFFSALTGANPAAAGEIWGNTPFLPIILPKLGGQVAFTARSLAGLPFVISEPGFVLRFGEAGIGFDEVIGGIADGKLRGALALQRAGGVVKLGGRVAVEQARIEAFQTSDNERNQAHGRFDASLTFEGSGRTPAQLVAAMNGGGRLVVANGSLPHLSQAAFVSVIAAAGLAVAPDLPRLLPQIQAGLESGPLNFHLADAPLTLRDGVVKGAAITLVGAPIEAKVDAAFDFSTFMLDSAIDLVGEGSTTGALGPRLSIHYLGTVTSPRRKLDVRALGDYLNLRRFEGELAKLENLQRQIDERESHIRALEESERARKAGSDNPSVAPVPIVVPAPSVAPVPVPTLPRTKAPAPRAPPASVNPRFRSLVEGSLRALPNDSPTPAPPGTTLAPLPPPIVIPSAPPIRP